MVHSKKQIHKNSLFINDSCSSVWNAEGNKSKAEKILTDLSLGWLDSK